MRYNNYKKSVQNEEKPCRMKPKTTEDPQNRIFQMRLENMINMEHELVLLSEKINWKAFEKKFGEVYIQDVGGRKT